MAIKTGDKIKVDYTGSLEDGTVFDTSEGKQPLEFEVGSGQIIKGFDEAVIGMEKDQEKVVNLASEQAYGEPNPQLVQKVPKEQMPKPPEGQELQPGMTLAVGLPNGQQMPARITEVSDKDVTLDLNHPLAGKKLTFKIKVVDIQ
jgi:FKBP-type peptidyl-prolyl cis-trans isomerase 2